MNWFVFFIIQTLMMATVMIISASIGELALSILSLLLIIPCVFVMNYEYRHRDGD